MSEAESAAADARAREAATDPARSVVLQAPAGSGKTTVLTARFMRLLATVDEPEEILAVTFTRKAAAEMRARIVEALETNAPANPRAHSWDLGNNPGRLRIQTIDSFNFWLASQLPVTAKAGGTLSVDDRPQELYARAARATLVEGEKDPGIAADIELLFERLDNRWNRVEELLAQMLESRGHWLHHVMSDPAALRARMTASLGEMIGAALTSARAKFPAGVAAAAQALPIHGQLGCDPADLATWQRLVGLLLTAKGAWRKFQGAVAPARQALARVVEELAAVPDLLPLLQEIALMPAAALDPNDARALDAFARVLFSGALHLQLEFSLAGRVDHTYVAGAARQALTAERLPSDLALRAGLSLKHILVDEFQDISLGQFGLLEALTVGWEEGDGRTLFVVGDPMQSIYQFRDAEVGLMLRIRDQGIGALRLESLHLTRNFRSVALLVEWTNARFARLLPGRDDVRTSAVSFTPSLATRAAEGAHAVEISWFAPRGRAAEAACIAARIRALKDESPAATIAVLVSARAHAGPIAAALSAQGVSSVGVKIVPLAELSVIRDLVALLRALHNLADRAAWLVVLRAPWCGATLATLAALSEDKDPMLLWEAFGDEARLARCTEEERARLARLRKELAGALAARGQAPLAEWLERTWVQLGGCDAYSLADVKHARAFFTAIAERTANGNWDGPGDLEILMQQLFAAPDAADNPVQIMTIHHAKGLQFHHVFVPCLERDLNRGPEPLMRWLDLPRSGGGSDLLVAPVPRTGARQGGILGLYIKHLMKVRGAHEQLRLLYVAATRARQSLHLSAAPQRRADGTPAPRAGTLLARLWPALDAAELPPTMPVTEETLEYPVLRLQRLRAAWQPAMLPAAAAWPHLPIKKPLESVEFSWVGETARHVGTVVHAALQDYAQRAQLPSGEEIGAQQARYRRELARHGVPQHELSGAAARVVEALTRACEDERGRWILSNAHREAASELALTGIAAGRLQNVIIDRSFIDEHGIRWVIDYKTSTHEGADTEAFLKQQLERYRAQLTSNSLLARALGPQPVRSALYLPLLGAFRELPLSEGVGDRE
jgi:ATP-dependent exoDNAse (exonuclease V) beta subunit